MGKSRMATHSKVSFDESAEIRILAGVLESKRKIKTFFKENDRTPNHDGNFEIINEDYTPKKQFIVQIKKVENLTAEPSGKNKGKYVYSLDTAFLYYIKEKVTESPAIYFVVDIVNQNIFWLYLSDEFLMSLNFEGKSHISYAFAENDKLIDIDSFTEKVNKISMERNSWFLTKTSQEISDIQDAVDYINHLMNDDFAKIKETIFPNLWRFGIRHSHTSDLSIVTGGKTITSDNTALFALYPQIKGIADTGIKEYIGADNNYFNTFDLSGKTTPMEYSKKCLHKIIKSFFENGIPMEYLPDIVLMEKLNAYVYDLQRLYDFTIENEKIFVNELYRANVLLIKYTQHILLDQIDDKNEVALKNKLISNYSNGNVNFHDIINDTLPCKASFKEFCDTYQDELGFSPNMFQLITKKDIQAFVCIAELYQRNVKFFEEVWNYDYHNLQTLEPTLFINEINAICEKWFAKLPQLYDQVYNILFEKTKYHFKGRFEYTNEFFEKSKYRIWFQSIIRKHKDTSFSIIFNPNCGQDEEDKDTSFESIQHTLMWDRFIGRKTLFFDSLTFLLYQGICNELGIENETVNIGGLANRLF